MSRIEQHDEARGAGEQHRIDQDRRRRWDDERRPGRDLGDNPLALRWSRC